MLKIDTYIDSQEENAEADWIGHLPRWHDYVAAKNLISSYGPYRFFMTLTFRYEISDSDGKEALARLWRRLMKKVLGKRWIRKGLNSIGGIAVLERAQLFDQSTREFGSCHFHLLVHDHPDFPKDDLLAAMRLWLAFIDAAKQLTHKNRRWQLVSKHGLDLQLISPAGVDRLYRYVAKEALQSDWRWDERVFYLGTGGI